MRRSRRLARLAATLTVGKAGVSAGPVSSQPAWARDTGTVIQSHVVASWGLNDYIVVTRPVNAFAGGSGFVLSTCDKFPHLR